MRMRLIDAWDLEARLRANAAELDTTIYTAPADEINALYRQFTILIRHSPIIDAEPVRHGRWVWKGHHLLCSECGKDGDRTLYCPNCGARMDEVSE